MITMNKIYKSFITCNNGTFAISSDSIYSFGLKPYKCDVYFTINDMSVIRLTDYMDESHCKEVGRLFIKEITNFIKYQEGENLDIDVSLYNIMKQLKIVNVDNDLERYVNGKDRTIEANS